MARRGIPKQQPAWYLKEWMAACGFSGRGAQARMMEETGWSKATMSQLYNGQQDFNSDILRTAARALNAREWELLMLPEMAMRNRRVMEELLQIAVVETIPPVATATEEARRNGTR